MRKTEHEQLNELTDFLKLEIGITPPDENETSCFCTKSEYNSFTR